MADRLIAGPFPVCLVIFDPGLPFIGIGAGAQAACLAAEGAVCVFPDLRDADLFLRRLNEIVGRD